MGVDLGLLLMAQRKRWLQFILVGGEDIPFLEDLEEEEADGFLVCSYSDSSGILEEEFVVFLFFADIVLLKVIVG